MRLSALGYRSLELLSFFRSPFRVFLLTLAMMPLVATLLFNIVRLPASFSVSANTEVLDMTITERAGTTRWYVRDAVATFGVNDPVESHEFHSIEELWNIAEPRPKRFTGFVDIGSCMRVHMVRYGSGTVNVTIEPEDLGNLNRTCPEEAGDSSRTNLQVRNLLDTSQTELQPLRSISIEVNVEDYPFSGGFQGVGNIGVETYDTNTAQAPPMLHEGRVTVLGTALLTDDRFEVTQLPLELGDEVHVIDQAGRDVRTTCVFSAGKNVSSGFAVSCRARENILQISRLGAHPFELRPTLWAYLKGDPVLQTLLVLIGSALMIIFQYVLSHIPVRPNNTKSRQKK